MSYPGGKNGCGVYQRLINLMPPHRVYIEPFLGGGAVMRLKRPAVLNIGIDLVDPAKLPMLDPNAGNSEWARVMILEPAPKMTTPDPHARNGERARGRPPETPIPAKLARIADAHRRASPVLKFSAEAAVSSDGARGASPVLKFSAEAAVSSDGARGRFELYQGDGIQFLEHRRFERDELVYCDPPYLRSTRSGHRLYEHEMTDVDHRRLLRAVRNLPCMVMLSGYWSGMYARALKTWNRIEYETMTRGGMATEHLWFNFPPPVELHDYRYLGENFRQRERIKRKKQRWTARLRRMPTLERQALLAAIGETAVSGDAGSARRF